MISRRSLCAFAVLGFLLPAGFAAAQDNPRIATVNVGKIFNDMQETKDYKQKLESDRAAVQGEAKRRNDEIEAAKQARSIVVEGSEEFNKKSKDLIEKTMQFRVWQELYNLELARQQKAQFRSLFEKIEEATKQVATAKKLDLVIVDQKAELPMDLEQIDVKSLLQLMGQRNVMFNNQKFDITAEVLVQVDQNYKARK